MGMNKQTGNMYPFVTHTWNPIRGECPHQCIYCYMRRFPQPEFRFVKKELETDLGHGNFIFVGSSTDMWADVALSDWLFLALHHCQAFDNTYLFQTKNPKRYRYFSFPIHFILGTTIETNRTYNASNAPDTIYRYREMVAYSHTPKMVSIEPIMDFDLDVMVDWISKIAPQFVSIGADSKRHNLIEPPPDKINSLVQELSKITEVRLKDNLKRLIAQFASFEQ